MEKGYYRLFANSPLQKLIVAIHNKNGKGLLQFLKVMWVTVVKDVAIHNKNGKGLLR